jgi:hypothetical protein
MDLELRKKKAWSEFGVSEIIGNILILMITVTLFSGIMAFVQQMPVPEQATKADFAAKVTFWSLGTKANLTVTHTGGDSIKAKDCIALVEVDGVNTRYDLSNPILGLKGTTTWTTGVVWAVTLSTSSYSSKIAVTVVDMVKKSAIWSSQVTGGTSGNAPNILQRYVDSDNQTPTADPVREWQNFSLFVTITDPDGDLNMTTPGIWIDSSQLETDKLTSYSQHRTDYTPNGDTYQWDFTNILGRELSASDLDGRIIFIHAWDNHGHQSISSFTMSILQLPVDIQYQDINPQEQPPAGDSFLPTYIKWFYDNQGIGIFGERILNGTPRGIAETSISVTSFAKDQYVFVRFASKVMANILTENKLTLIDIRTGLSVTPRFNGSSTASSPFYPMSGGGGIYLYECQFNTSPLPAGAYSLEISLKNQPSTGDPQRAYGGDKTIFITDSSSPITFYPQIFLFKDSGHTVPWGNVSSKPYQVSSSDKYKIYVAVQVQDTDTLPAAPSVAEVRITDGAKNAELYGVPPAGAMISSIGKFSSGTSYYYNFSIDLRLNNGVQWRAGNNTYSLFISKLNDSNEGMYSLSEQVFINGAGGRADFFAGTTGMAEGNGNFNTREYAFYIQNSNLFGSRVLWKSESTPGSSTDYTVTAMAVGDIDGDGAKDLLAGMASSNQLLLFQNTLNTFGTWQSGSAISRPDAYASRVTWIAFGDVNGDGHDDFAYSNSNSQVVIYNTTYGSTGWIFAPSGWGGSTISKIDLRDMTGDGRADLVVLAGGKIYVYDLKYFFDKALWADRTTDKKGTYAVSTGTSVDFDIDDVNNDGRLDIATADTTLAFSGGANGVNVNYWTAAGGTKKVLDATYGSSGCVVGQGAKTANNVSNTQLVDNVAVQFSENSTGAGQIGHLVTTMKFQQLANTPDQQLTVVARIGASGGSSSEVFYAWISIDGTTYIPVITIDSTSWKWYNFTLPSSVQNKALYLRFTDSNTMSSSGVPTDYIEVDMAAVYTDLFSGYVGQNVVPATTGYTCVRIGSIDGVNENPAGDHFLEIVVAKNSLWNVYNYTTSWVLLTTQFAAGAPFPGATSTFFVSSATKVGTGFFTGLAPTLFDVVDINGDGFSDILVTNLTNPSTFNSYIGFYMNLWNGSGTYWRYFSVKSWLIDTPVGQAKDPWVDIVVAANLTIVD